MRGGGFFRGLVPVQSRVFAEHQPGGILVVMCLGAHLLCSRTCSVSVGLRGEQSHCGQHHLRASCVLLQPNGDERVKGGGLPSCVDAASVCE